EENSLVFDEVTPCRKLKYYESNAQHKSQPHKKLNPCEIIFFCRSHGLVHGYAADQEYRCAEVKHPGEFEFHPVSLGHTHNIRTGKTCKHHNNACQGYP